MHSRTAWEALGGDSKDRVTVDVASGSKVLTKLVSHRASGKELGPIDTGHADQCVIDEMRVVDDHLRSAQESLVNVRTQALQARLTACEERVAL